MRLTVCGCSVEEGCADAGFEVMELLDQGRSVDADGIGGLGQGGKAHLDRMLAHMERYTGKPATTTVLTVLGRLQRKGLVTRERDGRAHHYRAVGSREDHVAELMNVALDTAADRSAALARFVGSIPPEERARLRDLLD